MKFRNKITLTAMVALAVSLPALAETEGEGGQAVTVRFTGVDPEQGTLWISLCTREEAPKITRGGCAHNAKIAAKEGAQHTFKPKAPGTYVISAYHDDNDNGRFDFNDQGIPFEAIGNSRNAVGEFGPPSFDQTKFDVRPRSETSQVLSMTIEMRRIEMP
ncbi:MAG: DUF2141 domain-containing protein [Pseudomonadota bacterium]